VRLIYNYRKTWNTSYSCHSNICAGVLSLCWVEFFAWSLFCCFCWCWIAEAV